MLSLSQSGRMYYMNRKTLKKSWNWPENKEQQIDLELNISNCSSNIYDDHDQDQCCYSSNKNTSSNNDNSNNMVALACLNCHLLVILSKSSPSCPNCKYVHSLSALEETQPPNLSPPPPPNTLSLLKY